MNERDGMTLKYIAVDKQSVLNTIERIQHYVDYYKAILRYSNHSVKRKKIQVELIWWEQELINHKETISKMELNKLQEKYIQMTQPNNSSDYSYLGSLGVSPKHLKMYEESLKKLEEQKMVNSEKI